MKRRLILTTILLVVTTSNAQNIKSSITKSYEDNSYINQEGKNYEYDDKGNLISESFFDWDDNDSGWIPAIKNLYTYNSNDKITKKLTQKRGGNQSQFVDDSQQIYTYNSESTVKISQEWKNGDWENLQQTTVSYNDNKLTEAILEKWKDGTWINDVRNTTTYTDDKLTQTLTEKFSNGGYVYDYKVTFTYDSNHKKTTHNKKWNGATWDDDVTKQYFLDQAGNRTSETFISSSNDNYRIEYSYDASSFLEDFYHPFEEKTGFDYFFEDFPYVNKIISQTTLGYNPLTEKYDVPSSRITYDYENAIIPLSTQNFEGVNNVNVYPNPSSEFILISGLHKNENIKIYDVLGKVVKEKIVVPNQKIDIQDLNNGIYFLKIENRHTLKLVKK